MKNGYILIEMLIALSLLGITLHLGLRYFNGYLYAHAQLMEEFKKNNLQRDSLEQDLINNFSRHTRRPS